MIKLEYNLQDLDKPLNDIFTRSPEKWNYMLNLKAIIGSAFSNLERLFKGCFGQGLDLDCTAQQYEVFKRVFPVIGKILEKCDKRESMSDLCLKLLIIRNECMHARSRLFDDSITLDARLIKALPNYGTHPYVSEDGRLTLAGLLAILLCMANKEMTGSMAASGLSEFIHQIGLFKGYAAIYGKAFGEILEAQLGTDLEAEIRTEKGNDPMTALWGEYLRKVKVAEGEFEYKDSETFENSLHIVRGSMKSEGGRLVLRIRKGSFYHLYFPEEYCLAIDDVPYFTELANKVPPFMLIPFLYRAGVKRLYRGVLTERQEELCGKLNKAKFYVDKNVNILLLGNSVSDQRKMSQSAMPPTLYCFLNLEQNLYWHHAEEIQSANQYSTLADGLKAIQLNQRLIDEAVALRNFFAHGFILGDYYGRAMATYRKFNLCDVIRVFRELVEAIVPVDLFAGNRLMGDVAGRLAEQLADMKYKDYAKKWEQIIDGHRPLNDQLFKPMLRVQNSCLTKELEEELGWFFYNKRFTRYTVFDIEVHPDMVLKCNGQPIGMNEVKIVLMKREINLSDIFGPIGQKEFATVESTKNPLVNFADRKVAINTYLNFVFCLCFTHFKYL